MIRDKVKKIYTTLYNALHQNFYTSCEIFTPAALAPLATFSISEVAQVDRPPRRAVSLGHNVHSGQPRGWHPDGHLLQSAECHVLIQLLLDRLS